MVIVNGEKIENIAGKNALEYLLESGYDMKRVAVEINGEILPKAQYQITTLKDGDCMEVVSFVGGG